jgi:hypothetical protein
MSETLILTVTYVQIRIERSYPPALIIEASGEVRSLGFRLAKLNPYYYTAAPEDGIYELAFVASEPEEFEDQVISPVNATPFRWDAFPADLKGIKIIAETNALEKILFEEPQLSPESIY